LSLGMAFSEKIGEIGIRYRQSPVRPSPVGTKQATRTINRRQ
jgi:hypothetical protein